MKIAFYKEHHSGVGKAKDVYYQVESITIMCEGRLISFSHSPLANSGERESICCNLPFKIICEAGDNLDSIRRIL